MLVPIDKPQAIGNCWYAIRVRPRFERLANEVLTAKGHETFLPLYSSNRQWSDRSKELWQPLFPSYLFCRFDMNDRLVPVISTPGVISIVGAGKTPIPIPDPEIAAIQSIIRSGLAAQPGPRLPAGARVSIVRGPLTGLEGIVLAEDTRGSEKTCRLVVSVQLLQRSVAVKIDPGWAQPVSDALAPHILERLAASASGRRACVGGYSR